MFNSKVYSPIIQRINRKTFWAFATMFYLAYGFLFFLMKLIADYQSNPNWWHAIEIVRVLFCFAFFPILVKRLHDINLSGWFCLLAFLPICTYPSELALIAITKGPMIGSLILGFIVGLIPGTRGQNKYDENPIPMS